MLSLVEVTKKSRYKNDIKALNEEAFPKSVRMGYWLIDAMGRRKSSIFYAITDDNKFVGFTFVTLFKDMAYVLYLATDKSVRNSGYGSKTLDLIKEKYKDYRLTLTAKTIGDGERKEINERRLNFYARNGFNQMSFVTDINHVTKEVLVCDDTISSSEYYLLLKAVFPKITRPFLKFKMIEKV